MITRQSLQDSALYPFPWGGKTKNRKELKGKSLLYLLFKNPKYFMWAYDQSYTSNKLLFIEMKVLLDAIATINPIVICGTGKPAKFWSFYKGQMNGHFLACDDFYCGCQNDNCYLVRHTFGTMIPKLANGDMVRYWMDYFKRDYGLPPRFSEEKYLQWVLDNADLQNIMVKQLSSFPEAN